jgi:hypothetical protein
MWEVIDDVEEASSSPSLTMLRNDKRPVSVILVDGSARTQLHINTITEDILRTKGENHYYSISSYLVALMS